MSEEYVDLNPQPMYVPEYVLERTHMDFHVILNIGSLAQINVSMYRYHLMLAQVLLSNSTALNDAIHIREHVSIQSLILDNGAHEGELVTDSDYIRIVKELDPTMVVLPDLIGQSSEESAARTVAFYKRLRENDYTKRVMLVGQGTDLQDTIECYRQLLEWVTLLPEDQQRLVTFGYGQAYAHVAKTIYDMIKHFVGGPYWAPSPSQEFAEMARRFMIARIFEEVPYIRNWQAHLLGARWAAFTDPLPCNFVSFDSYKPTSAAMYNKTYPYPPERAEQRVRNDLDERCVLQNALKDGVNNILQLYRKQAYVSIPKNISVPITGSLSPPPN
jgi:hypothetical protein